MPSVRERKAHGLHRFTQKKTFTTVGTIEKLRNTHIEYKLCDPDIYRDYVHYVLCGSKNLEDNLSLHL